MFTIVLYQPEIPPNTGNIIRLCANTSADLHLVKPLGFPLDSAKMKRAGLDYHEFASLTVYENFDDCLKALAGRRIFALTTKGTARPDETAFQKATFYCSGRKRADCLPTSSTACPPRKKSACPCSPAAGV